MSAGDVTQGRRLPDDTNIDDWLFGADGASSNREPGDYIVRGVAVWICMPNGSYGRIPIRDEGHGGAVWGFTEHEDGSITLTPSISYNAGRPDAWHGFLERGAWREV